MQSMKVDNEPMLSLLSLLRDNVNCEDKLTSLLVCPWARHLTGGL